MLVPDFWPERLATPEETYTTPKESYMLALKRILQSSALGIPIRQCLLLAPVILSKKLYCKSNLHYFSEMETSLGIQ